MISLEEAIKIAETKKEHNVISTGETDDRYIFGMDDGSSASYTTVDKETGEVSIMWMMEYLDLLDDNKVKTLDM